MVDGLLTTGFFKKNSHDLVSMEDFHIQDPEIDRIILVVRDILRKYAIEAYDEEKHTGDLRHIIVRRGLRTSQVMIILVTRTEKFVQKEAVVEQITQQLPEVVSIVQNIQPHQSNVIMGSQKKVLFGEDAFQEALMEFTFTISSRSFFQVNTIQTEVLYHEAIQASGLTGDETVVDAYCGIGTMSLAFAKRAKKVYAMEIVPDAIQMAKENARINKIDNVTFEVGAAEKVMPTWVDSGLQPDVIVVDPPRKGLDGAFIDAAVKTRARKIVYVSCNPATLARDLALFQEKGYQALYAQPVDMFPMTTAIETIVLLSKLDSKKYISVELPIDDMELTSAESKVTYKQIQNYVLEKFGFKVSTLYIAQVNKKHGLEVREHYNISKNENQKVLQCPIEKEKAILDALKHFKMLYY